MRLNEHFDVDYQEIQEVRDEINEQFAVFDDWGSGHARRVNGRYENRQARFVESDGVRWCPGVIVDLAVVRPAQRVALLKAIAEVYFSQGWESSEAPLEQKG